MFGIGWTEVVLLGLVAVLIFGKRLPEVGRNLGKGIVEFKKGLSGIEDEVKSAGANRQLDHDAPSHEPLPGQTDSAQNKSTSA